MAVALRTGLTVSFGGGSPSTAYVQVNGSLGVGDYAIASIRSGSTGATPTGPAGWTLLANSAASTTRNFSAWGKVITATDITNLSSSNTVLWTYASTGAVVDASLVAFTGVNPTTPLNAAGAVSYVAASTTTATATGVTSSVANWMDVLITMATNGPPTAAGYTQVSNPGADAVFYAPVAAAGTSASATTTWTTAVAQAYSVQLAVAVNITAPLAPTLTSPTNATYTDLASTGGPFQWTYNNTDGTTQQSYRFRRKISGAATYEYWNVGTGAFQSTAVDNTSSSGSLTFSAGIFTDGNVYNWSVTTTSSAGLVGVYAADSTVSASIAPTVTVTSPTGTQSTTTPTVAWTTTIQAGMGQAQTAYQVRVESGSFGAAPGSGTGVYSSGLVSGAATSVVLPSLLAGTPYRVFVQVTVTGGQVSSYGAASFTITADPLAAPALSGYYDTAGQRSVIVVQGRDNMLTADGASFETATGGWVAGANTTVARSMTQALLGAASLAVTATAAGTAVVSQSVAGSAGQTYTAFGSARAAATSRTVTVGLVFLDGAAAVLGSTSGAATDTTTGWVQATATAVAPAGTVSVQMTYGFGSGAVVVVPAGVLVGAFTAQLGTVASTPGNIVPGAGAGAATGGGGGGTAAAGEVHYLDNASIAPGVSTVWSRGGVVGAVTAIVERSSNGGATWILVRGSGPTIPSPAQQVTVIDLEPAPNSPVLYRARGTIVM